MNPCHPYLENVPAPSFDPHHLRIQHSRAAEQDIDRALEEGFRQGVAQAMSDGILTRQEEERLRTFRDNLALENSAADSNSLAELDRAGAGRGGPDRDGGQAGSHLRPGRGRIPPGPQRSHTAGRPGPRRNQPAPHPGLRVSRRGSTGGWAGIPRRGVSHGKILHAPRLLSISFTQTRQLPWRT